ncbi:MAG: hypothetical protein GF364_16400 [Candidatus Lokiarchaeota archaeon]|nr:hypothetical protein [Candidatus Lokiarchaeota archaeon]
MARIMTILDEIARSRQQDVPLIREILNNGLLAAQTQNRQKLSSMLDYELGISVISELKPGSPSKGQLIKIDSTMTTDLKRITTPTVKNIREKVIAMIDGGARAISVLTEPIRFSASFGNLLKVCELIGENVPILLKDFIISEEQIRLGKLCGASNALLIASICDPLRLAKIMKKHDLEPLVEIHDESDLDRIKVLKDSDIKIVIGINNRNLKDLSTSFIPTYKLISEVHKIFGNTQPVITESGISDRGDIIELSRLDVNGALVGTIIMKSNIKNKVKELVGNSQPFIKICGVTDSDILTIFPRNIVTAFGVIVDVPTSPRNITTSEAKDLFEKSPKYLQRTIVTKGKTIDEVLKLNEMIKPDLIQVHLKNYAFVEQLPKKLYKKLLVPIKMNTLGVEKTIKTINSLPPSVFGIVLDSSEGSGQLIDLNHAKQIVKSCKKYKIILAGGISERNVNYIYNEVQPFGIDVSSSLEENKGKKSPALVQNYIHKIKKIKKSYF